MLRRRLSSSAATRENSSVESAAEPGGWLGGKEVEGEGWLWGEAYVMGSRAGAAVL